MSINDIEALGELISTAQAAYGILSKDGLLDDLKNTDHGADFTEIEAQKFVDQYKVISPTVSFFSGFQAVVFQDKKAVGKVLAIRGSEQLGQDFAWADGGDIKANGYANNQSVDLYR